MVKKRKFSHKKFRIVKGGFTRFLHEGQKRSAEDSSLPQSGHFFIILLCTASDLINDFMKTGILRQIFFKPGYALLSALPGLRLQAAMRRSGDSGEADGVLSGGRASQVRDEGKRPEIITSGICRTLYKNCCRRRPADRITWF